MEALRRRVYPEARRASAVDHRHPGRRHLLHNHVAPLVRAADPVVGLRVLRLRQPREVRLHHGGVPLLHGILRPPLRDSDRSHLIVG